MKNWKSLIIISRPDSSLREAMRVIDAGSSKTVFVVSEQMYLLGVVTDGDIRRGLLRSSHMDDHITTVMNSSPVFCVYGTRREEVKRLLKSNDIYCIPIVQDGRVVDIETLKSVEEYTLRENGVFIMAGGLGTRLRPLTEACPKPMLEVGNKPMLEHLVFLLSKQGFKKFYFSTHYLPEVIHQYFGDGSRFGVNIEYVYEAEPLGTGGALGLLPQSIPHLPLVVLNGDVLTNLDFTKLLDFHEAMGFDATMCLRETEHQISYGVVETEDNLVVGMREKPTYRHDINTGIYILSHACVSGVSAGERIDMPSYLEHRISQGHRVGAMRHTGYWLDIGRITDYERAQKDIDDILHPTES